MPEAVASQLVGGQVAAVQRGGAGPAEQGDRPLAQSEADVAGDKPLGGGDEGPEALSERREPEAVVGELSPLVGHQALEAEYVPREGERLEGPMGGAEHRRRRGLIDLP